MELIPVFSLIVLVATMGTFILAVVAYLMFKIREKRGRGRTVYEDAATEAEVIVSSRSISNQGSAQRRTGGREHASEQNVLEYKPDEYVSVSHHNPKVRVQ